MTVATILKAKGHDVETVAADALLSGVVQTLARKKIGCVVVVDDQHRVIGIVSERDIVRAIGAAGASELAKPVSQLMTSKVICCSQADTTEQLMSEMTRGRFRHIPVVDGDKLIGIVSIGDVVKLRLAEAELEAQSMRAYIATG